jgi:hypothetical protein
MPDLKITSIDLAIMTEILPLVAKMAQTANGLIVRMGQLVQEAGLGDDQLDAFHELRLVTAEVADATTAYLIGTMANFASRQTAPAEAKDFE